jgi:hypothetical protein
MRWAVCVIFGSAKSSSRDFDALQPRGATRSTVPDVTSLATATQLAFRSDTLAITV